LTPDFSALFTLIYLFSASWEVRVAQKQITPSIDPNPLTCRYQELQDPNTEFSRARPIPRSSNMLSRPARTVLRPSSILRILPRQRPSSPQLSRLTHPITSRRQFHTSPRTHKGLQPDSADPAPPKSDIGEGGGNHANEPANISVEEYHEIADEYLDELLLSLEEKSETGGSGFDVEYSVRLP
jgi:hypothetical protein